MKSPQLEALGLTHAETAKYTSLKVMRSNAGHYVGSAYVDGGHEEPGTRDSGYFRTEAEAAAELAEYEAGLPTARPFP